MVDRSELSSEVQVFSAILSEHDLEYDSGESPRPIS